MRISLIAALDRNRVIGAAGRIPWRLPADMRYFRQVTMGKPVIMGRKTYESIGRALPGRHNIVVTSQDEFEAPGCTVVHSISSALEAAGSAEEVMVIGGSHLYRQMLPLADRLYLTFVEACVAGDTYFPEFDPDKWELLYEKDIRSDDKNPFPLRFVILTRRQDSSGSGLPR